MQVVSPDHQWQYNRYQLWECNIRQNFIVSPIKTKDYVKRKISKITTSYLIPDCFKKGIIFEGKLIVWKIPVKTQLNHSQIFWLIVTEINAHIRDKILYAIKIYFGQQSYVLEMMLKRTIK